MSRRSRLGLALALAATAAWADDAAPAPGTPAEAKPSLSQQIQSGLPKYSPPPPAPAEPKPGDPIKPVDPNAPADMLVLPKMTVKQKPRPRLNPEIVATPKALGEALMKQRTTELDRALNKYTLPLFGASAQQAYVEELKREKARELNDDVNRMAKALEKADAGEAKSLKDAAAGTTP